LNNDFLRVRSFWVNLDNSCAQPHLGDGVGVHVDQRHFTRQLLTRGGAGLGGVPEVGVDVLLEELPGFVPVPRTHHHVGGDAVLRTRLLHGGVVEQAERDPALARDAIGFVQHRALQRRRDAALVLVVQRQGVQVVYAKHAALGNVVHAVLQVHLAAVVPAA
jgi:hypothetical protein